LAFASGNTIGGTSPAARNIISGSVFSGVAFLGGSNNVVQGNYIGTDVMGATALGNQGGVWIDGSTGNTIGGTAPGAGNLISGHRGFGVEVTSNQFGLGPSTGNNVLGNYIGTDASGTLALANTGAGVLVDSGSTNNTIGGTTAGAGNAIAFNSGAGVAVVDN